MISQWCKPQGTPHKSCPGQKHKSCCFHVTQQNKKGPSIPSKICRFCFAVSNQPQNHTWWQWDPKWHFGAHCHHMIHHPDSLSFCNRTYQHWELNRWRELFYDSIPSVAISTGRNLSLKSSSISFLSNVQSMSDMYTTSWKCIALFLDSRNYGLQLEDHSFWRWFWFDRRQGERLWSVTTDQAPFFFKLRRAKIGFDAFQRKALYCETRLVLKTLIPFLESESHDHFDNLAQIAGQMVQHRLSDNENFLNLKKLSLLVSLCCTINDQSTIWKSDSTDWSSNANHKAKSAWLWLKSKLLD